MNIMFFRWCFRVIFAGLFCLVATIGVLFIFSGSYLGEDKFEICRIVKNNHCHQGEGQVWVETGNFDQKMNMTEVFCRDYSNCCQYEINHNTTMSCLFLSSDQIAMVFSSGLYFYISNLLWAGVVVLSLSGFCCALAIISLIIEHRKRQYRYIDINNQPHVQPYYSTAEQPESLVYQ